MKILGIIILILSGTAAGYFFGEKYTEKIKFWNQYINLITLIKNQIICSAAPLKSILKNSNTDYPIKSCVDICLGRCKNQPFVQAWRESFEIARMNFELSEEEKGLIKGFGTTLGTSDCKTQFEACDKHIEMISPYLKKAIEEKNAKGKLPLVLGASIGSAVAILLI